MSRRVIPSDGIELHITHSKGNVPASHAVFIVPYASDGELGINVLYGVIVPTVDVSATGRRRDGSVSVHHTIKDFGVESGKDAQRQVEGYLNLARMTEGSPISVVRVENPLDLPLEEAALSARNAYEAHFFRSNARRVEAWRATAARDVKEDAFNTGAGWMCNLSRRYVTAYPRSIDDGMVRMAIGIKYPERTPTICGEHLYV